METYLNLAIEGQDITERNQNAHSHSQKEKKTLVTAVSPPTKKAK